MSHTYTAAERSTLRRQTVSAARVLDITFQNGERRYLTLHDQQISRFQRPYFRPQPGLAGFSIHKETGIKGTSSQLVGSYDPNGFGLTYRDLRGRFVQDALCEIRQVNWEWPFHGRGHSRVTFAVRDFEYDEYEFSLSLVSVLERLDNKRGENYTPLCLNELGVIELPTSFCRFDLSPYPFTVSGVSVYNLATPTRQQFEVVKTTTEPLDSSVHVEDFFTHGRVEWTLGANSGLEEKIEKSEPTAVNRQLITLQRPMPFDVDASTDLCTLVVGCNKTEEECESKFGQFQISFRGAPHIPGNLSALRTPAAN